MVCALCKRVKLKNKYPNIFVIKGEFLPLYKVRARKGAVEKHKPLFPGYVFCRLSPGTNGLIITTPGVISIVGFGGKLMPVETREIEALKKAVALNWNDDNGPQQSRVNSIC